MLHVTFMASVGAMNNWCKCVFISLINIIFVILFYPASFLKTNSKLSPPKSGDPGVKLWSKVSNIVCSSNPDKLISQEEFLALMKYRKLESQRICHRLFDENKIKNETSSLESLVYYK